MMPARRPENIARMQERNQAVIALNRAHPELTLAQIGMRMGLSKSMISRIMAEHRRKEPTPARLAKRDAALLEARLRVPTPTLKALAQQFGLSVSSVIRSLKRAEKARDQPLRRIRAANPRPSCRPDALPHNSIAIAIAIARDPAPHSAARGDIGCSDRSAS